MSDCSEPEKVINILLLGESGVGKSTFINSVANYLTFGCMETAATEELLVLIPTSFSVQDKDKKKRTINIGSKDHNEFVETGVAGTQGVKTYVFPIRDGQVNVRLIDTPGMGDPRGIKQDNTNSEYILSYIGQLKELHAICFLFKPNQSRQTVFFQYCMAQIFSRLDKSASRNVVFIFTNARGSDYSGGDTLSILQKVVNDIKKRPPYVDIPIDRNVFCFDNEAFRYLAAVRNGVKFTKRVHDFNNESWTTSSKGCWNLIKYILGDNEHPALKPHFIQSTTAINEGRRMIGYLSQPLAEISQLIGHNMHLLQKHKENLQVEDQSLRNFKDQLFMPVVSLEAIELTEPVTVCTNRECSEIYQVGGRSKWHYKQRCHEPCYLQNVPKEIIGSPELINCAAMNREGVCKECDCNFQVHMHVYYLTKTKEIQEKDSNIEQTINSKEEIMAEVSKLINNMETKKEELESEHHIINTTTARFAHFLENNAITPFNDSYKEYIEYQITQEKSLGKLCKKETLDYLRKLLREYEETKASFEEVLKMRKNVSSDWDNAITPDEVNDSINELFKLKHNGKKIQQLFNCQKKSRKKEYQNTEYVHTVPTKKKISKTTEESHTKDNVEDKKQNSINILPQSEMSSKPSSEPKSSIDLLHDESADEIMDESDESEEECIFEDQKPKEKKGWLNYILEKFFRT